ncbi:DUF7543 family protein [Haloparvum sedimenti]|uniref:DUF7543 family protein n=1 Tax=Haloparvum sedimenti TaxID=1678448 RepID=UPI00071E7443|nr:hypothetical protein [Haloparvum sedimenti]
MDWGVSRDRDGVTEWERGDGLATVRVREKGGGTGFVVRIDVLEQAADGPDYRRESVADEDRAEALAAEWREAFAEPA